MKKKLLFAVVTIFLVQLNLTKTFSQTPISVLNPAKIPQFVDPLPHFAGLRVNAKAGGMLIIRALPAKQTAVSTGTILYTGDTVGKKVGKGLANVWGYSISKDTGKTWTPPMWPAFTIEAQRGNPLTMKYRNNLYGQTYLSVGIKLDQSIGWAAPTTTGNPLKDPYTGPVPICIHLHGGEVPSASDGGPYSWFTPGYAIKGAAWNSGIDSIYHYPNSQEEATLWFHDHVMGATRLNVYAGLAGYYFLRGPNEENDKLPGWSGDDLVQEVAPAGKSGVFNPNPYLPEVEIAIQDRMFDSLGGLYWPVDPPNPSLHPFWTPEFFGNVMTVNGKTWPYLSVAQRKYRFRFLDGCNARFLRMWLKNLQTGAPGPKLIQIGTDGGLLDTAVVFDPAKKQALFLAPGERADIIIDFTNAAPGSVWTLVDTARAPYPTGDLPDTLYNGRIMQFVVNGKMVSAANHSNPGSDKSMIPASLRPSPLVRLTDFAGKLNPKIAMKRQLILNEVEGGGGPEIVLVNNSRFDSMVTGNQFGQLTEKPVEGTTELWQIINTTMDAHPMHMHLVQFQLVSRQPFDTSYFTSYKKTFTGGIFIPGGGPPKPYNVKNADSAIGGNPAISPYLKGPVRYANPEEKGWKDTYKAYPGEVTTFIIRFAPTDIAVNATASKLLFTFDPSKGPGYVWHCHIVDHEDNEMMRPFIVLPSPSRSGSSIASQTFENYELDQNYPNPFHQTTAIRFSIPKDDHVLLKLYNNLGQEIQTLIDSEIPAGNHTVVLDGNSLNQGVYFYRIKSGNYSSMKKLILTY